MKTRHFSLIILAGLILAATLGLTTKAATKEILKKEVTIDNKKGEVQVGQGYLFSQKGDKLTLLKPDGTPIKDAVGLKIQKKDDAFILYRKGKKLAECAVFSEDGKVIIPFGPAVVEPLNKYFWTGSFAKKVTKDKNKALIYSTPNTFSITPQKGDTLYTGEKKVYDASTGKAVKNVKVTSPAARIDAVKDTLYVSDGNGKSVIYDKKGKALVEDASRYSARSSFYTTYEDGKNVVMDSKLKTIFKSENSMSAVGDSNDYFTYRADKYPVLTDKKGKDLFTYKGEGSLDELTCENTAPDNNVPNLFVFSSLEKKGDIYPHILLDSKGKVVNKTAYSIIDYAGAGFIKGMRKDGSANVYDVMDKKGKVIGKDFKDLSSFMIASKDGKSTGEKEYFIYDKKRYDLSLESASEIGPFLLASKDSETGKYGLYDVISGQHLLKESYDGIGYVYGRVYALKNNTYEVYSVNR